ncbi:putative entry exclusion protein TrbK-alt [Pseudorhodoplanes sp.]|uniref:putative entry exclusion protein TrbK-alt n=1 Tax=Pseudorhodoplanes sp. TaxID=1934341 RepID=UPI002BBA78A4|nr:putative entry exclusion protein TrbK-alt [Pseudorhodoplanes sp.]HWV51666.1 putative entry exclusion protein TrbK-alt [Pseudorhodoplanes sp.]
MPRTFLIVSLIALLLAGCTTPLRSGDGGATVSNSDAALDGRLLRCSALGAKAQDDPDCVAAFSEARSRILPIAPEK